MTDNKLYQGDNFTVKFKLSYDDDTPADITSFDFDCIISTSNQGISLLASTRNPSAIPIIVNGNILEVTISGEQSNKLLAGDIIVEIRRITEGGVVETISGKADFLHSRYERFNEHTHE